MRSDLRQALEESDLFARKSLGQHFLLDLNLTGKIVRLAGLHAGETILEIGPGPGGLTHALLASPASKIIVIEKDPRFVAHLNAFFQDELGRLVVVEGDALTLDEEALLASHEVSGPVRLISNLPYNVGTPLLVKWLKASSWRGPMCLMFQTEVAERICARPGSPHYGRLAVLAAARYTARLAMHVPRLAFVPPPKVESAIVILEDHQNPFDDLAGLEHVTSHAFGQRRKMLRASLKGLGNCELILEAAGIDPTARPETIEPAGFFALTRAWRSQSQQA